MKRAEGRWVEVINKCNARGSVRLMHSWEDESDMDEENVKMMLSSDGEVSSSWQPDGCGAGAAQWLPVCQQHTGSKRPLEDGLTVRVWLKIKWEAICVRGTRQTSEWVWMCEHICDGVCNMRSYRACCSSWCLFNRLSIWRSSTWHDLSHLSAVRSFNQR